MPATAVDALNKKYDKAVFEKYAGLYKPMAAIPTGSLLVDQSLGIGGIPEGRITVIWGPYSGGKSTLTLSICAQAQQKYPEKLIGWIDAECQLELDRITTMGVDPDRLLISHPDTGEQAWDGIEALLRDNLCSAIVVDSLPHLVPSAEVQGEFDDQQVGALARLTAKAMRKIGPLAFQSGTALIIINQVRANLRAVSQYSPQEIMPAGKALEHGASVILRVSRMEWIKQGDDVIGIVSGTETTKNKVAPPKQKAQFSILFQGGIDTDGELIQVGLDLGLVARSGAWFKYKGESIGQGKDNASRWLAQHPEVRQDIADAFRHR